MTTATNTTTDSRPPADPPIAPGRDRFAYLLRAEWTKFRTVRGWIVAVFVSMVLTVLLGLFISSHSHIAPCTTGPNGGGCSYILPNGPGGEAVTDTYYFVHRALTAEGTITVRMTSLSEASENGQNPQGGPAQKQPASVPWSKAGLIITAGSDQGAAYAAVMVTGSHGARMQWNYTGDAPGLAGDVSAASPRWLRLTRAGDLVTGYDSADGANWTEIGAVTLPGLASSVQAGLFVTSPGSTTPTNQGATSASGTSSGATDATADFDHVDLTGGAPGGSWTGTSVGGGSESPYPTGSAVGYRQNADGSFAVTGSGDIAPDVTDGVGVSVLFTGLFIALIAMVVIGALFMTAEYRRGLIRATLAASPRRGWVLAAKAVVLGGVTFAAELAALAATVLIGVPLLRSSGNPVYPVTVLTEARAIVGAAALTAVFAVFALGVGSILRHGAGAVTAALTAVVLPYLLTAGIAVLPTGAAQWLMRVTPAAGFSIDQVVPAYPQVAAAYTPANGFFPLAPWAGFAVACGYAVLALGLAAYLIRRRDA
ncbi:MAG TPA: ABC transporter permease subunit [Actinocrinis sp.]